MRKYITENKRKDFEDGHYLLMERQTYINQCGVKMAKPWHITYNSQCGY